MIDTSEVQHKLNHALDKINELIKSLNLAEKRDKARQIEDKMSAQNFWDHPEAANTLITERSELLAVIRPIEETELAIRDGLELLQLAIEECDSKTIDELAYQADDILKSVKKLETMALFSGEHDSDSCFLNINTGAGGADACEWSEMLLRLYTRFAERKNWKVEQLSILEGEEAGIKSVELRINGSYAYGHLKGEIGVHRLVRISPFSGKRETSFAAVDVVPEFKNDIEIEILDKELRIDTYRSGGKGGQHVNKTDSAVRITHLPTGIVVSVQNERSQHSNKIMAMQILKSRLYQRIEAERLAKINARNALKSENAWGSQIRNYVLAPYTMVKDVRTGHETGDTDSVLDGEIDDFVEAFLRWQME